MTELDFSFNSISTDGATQLCYYLKENRKLTKLDLSFSEIMIDRSVIHDIEDAIKANRQYLYCNAA